MDAFNKRPKAYQEYVDVLLKGVEELEQMQQVLPEHLKYVLDRTIEVKKSKHHKWLNKLDRRKPVKTTNKVVLEDQFKVVEWCEANARDYVGALSKNLDKLKQSIKWKIITCPFTGKQMKWEEAKEFWIKLRPNK